MPPKKMLFLVFTSVLTIYLFCAQGYVDTYDAVPSMETARSLIQNKSFEIHPQKYNPMFYAKSKDKKIYSKMGLMMPLLYLPLVWVGDFFSEKVTEGFISLLNSFLMAFIVILVFSYLSKKGIEKALFLTLTLAFATYLFAYSKTSHRDVFQGLCLISSIFLFKSNRPWLSGIFFGLGILTKPVFLITFCPFLFYFYTSKKVSQTWITPILISIIILLLHNFLTLGNFLNFGYHPSTMKLQGTSWSTSVWQGIYEQLFSFSNSYFIYNFIFLSLPFVIFYLVKQRKWTLLDTTVIISFVWTVLFYSRWIYPLGGETLGPRYLVPITPLLVLLYRNLSFEFFKKRAWVAVISACVLLAVLFQFISVSVKTQQHYTLYQRAEIETSPLWISNLKFFKNKFLNRPELYPLGKNTISLEDLETMQGFNFWWVHLKKITQPSGLMCNDKS